MADRMFGVETEYAFSTLEPGGRSSQRGELLQQVVGLMSERLPHLVAGMCSPLGGLHSSGVFLQNGSRFYIDCGAHPELAGPECLNPWDAVRYILAGERMLQGLAEEIHGRNPTGAQPVFFKCNVDYASGTTWACHESFLHAMDPAALPRQIIPHLVSRIVFTGAGGFNNRSHGIEFLVSPRMPHLQHVISDSSTGSRGIFHTKDEPLCSGGRHRLHLLCGESLCSQAGSWLKTATTAIVVALAEAGLDPGGAVELSAPLDAMWAFARDPTSSALAATSDGRRLSAIEIQRHYLALAEANSEKPFMPPWAAEVCTRWRAILDDLEAGEERVSRVLDWAIKLVLYEEHARLRGAPWGAFPHWNHVVDRLWMALQKTDYRGRQVNVELVLSRGSPVRPEVERLTPFLEEKGLCWEDLSKFLSLRLELFEIDVKFGQLGERGIFSVLERKGVLQHAVPGVDNIEHAMENPPAAGRARVRGECIQRLAAEKDRYLCDWNGLYDTQENRWCDLGDPFAKEAVWRKVGEGTHGVAGDEPGERMRALWGMLGGRRG